MFESNLSEKIEYEENIDQDINDITDTNLAAAKQSIPNKLLLKPVFKPVCPRAPYWAHFHFLYT